MNEAARALRIKRLRWALLAAAAVLGSWLVASQGGWSGGLGTWWQMEHKKLIILVKGAVWWGVAVDVMLLGLLAATVTWWCSEESLPASERWVRPPRRLLVGLLLIAIAAGTWRASRLTLSLYNDEAYSLRRQVVGSTKEDRSDHLVRFQPVGWVETVWENRGGNNSSVFSVLARTSYTLWRRASGASEGQVCEWAVRLPVFLAALGGIVATGCLGYRLGGERLGWLAGVVAACHPWEFRYGTEARCYGLLFLIIPCLLLALVRAWQEARWRWWIAVGVGQFLATACFLGSAYFLAVLNGSLGIMLGWQWWRHRDPMARLRLSRLVVAGVMAVALYLPMQLATFLQMTHVLDDPQFLGGRLNPRWFADVASELTWGMLGADSDRSNPYNFCTERWWHSSPVATGGALMAASALVLAGSVRLGRNSSLGLSVMLATWFGAALFIGHCLVRSMAPLWWHAVFLLPGFVLIIAAGLDAACDLALRKGWLVRMGVAGLAVLAWWPWLPQTLTLRHHSREFMRDAVELIRGEKYPASLRAGQDRFPACVWSEAPIYDPQIISIRSEEELTRIVGESRRQRRRLWVDLGYAQVAQQAIPGVIKRLTDPAEFDRIATLYGLDSSIGTHTVFRLRDDAVAVEKKP